MGSAVEEVVAIVLRDIAAASPIQLVCDPKPYRARKNALGVLLTFPGNDQLGVVVFTADQDDG